MSNLSGFWIGRYAYGENWDGTVRFDLECTHEGVSMTGIITEPNTFDPHAGELLSAAISGTVLGRSLSFSKTYSGEGISNHTIAYKGVLDKDETRIGGTWSIGSSSGPFEMLRDGPAIGVKARTESTPLDRVLDESYLK